MIKSLCNFIKNYFYNKYFYIPIIITVLINISHYLYIWFKYKNFFDFKYLCNYNFPLTDFLFIQTSIIIVFFAITQLILSRNNYSIILLNKCFFKNKITKNYISYNLGVVLILIVLIDIFINYFSRLNIILMSLFLFTSILSSLLYLYWILNNLSSNRLIKIISEQINNKYIKSEINEIIKNQNKYINLLNTYSFRSGFFSTNQNIDTSKYYKYSIQIFDSLIGNKYLQSIQIDRLITILDKILKQTFEDLNITNPYEYIKSIQFPKPGNIVDITSFTIDVFFESYNVQIHKINEIITSFDGKIREIDLSKYFTLTEKNIFYKNEEAFSEIIEIFLNTTIHELPIINNALEELYQFLINYKDLGKSEYSETIIKSMIELLIDRINYHMSLDQYHSFIYLLYSFQEFIHKPQSILILDTYFNLLTRYFGKLIRDYNEETELVEIFMLYFKEITLFELSSNSNEKSSTNANIEYIRKRLEKTIQGACFIYYHYLNETIRRRNYKFQEKSIINNFKQLKTILHDEVKFLEESDFINKDLSFFVEQILFLCSFILKEAKNNPEIELLLKKYFFPFINYFDSILENDSKIIDIIFFDYKLKYFRDCLYSHEFGEYTTFENENHINRLWFVLSLYRESNKQENPFLPTKYPLLTLENHAFSESYKQTLNTFKHHIENIQNDTTKLEYFSSIFNLNKSTINDFCNEYIIHIQKLIATHIKEKETLITEFDLDPGKIDSFKNNFLERYSDINFLSNILTEKSLLKENKPKTTDTRIRRSCFEQRYPKENFLPNVFAYNSTLGHGPAEFLAKNKEIVLIIQILEKCEEKNISDFEQILKNKDDSYFIIALNNAYRFFNNIKNFNSKINFSEEERSHNPPRYLFGYYDFKQKIPVYWLPRVNLQDFIIILNKDKFGKLFQYNPINNGEKPEDIYEDQFYIKIQSFDQIDNLIPNLLKENPDWLQEKKTQEEKEQYLKQQVLVGICEKFELKLADNFEGYKIIYNQSIN